MTDAIIYNEDRMAFRIKYRTSSVAINIVCKLLEDLLLYERDIQDQSQEKGLTIESIGFNRESALKACRPTGRALESPSLTGRHFALDDSGHLAWVQAQPVLLYAPVGRTMRFRRL